MRATLSFLLSLLAVAPATFAAPAASDKDGGRYDIEVLVFENRLPDLIGDELLGKDAATLRRQTLDTAVAAEPSTTESYLRPVVADALQRDGHYRLLGYAHWQQEFDPASKTPVRPIQIAAIDPTRAGELDGAVRFTMTRFLHLDVNVLFREPAAGDAAPTVYQINEQRRIKSQETNYFDHPRFGVLVRVMPLESDKKP